MCVLYVIPPSSFGSENWISETSGGAKHKTSTTVNKFKHDEMKIYINLHLVLHAKREQKSRNRNQ